MPPETYQNDPGAYEARVRRAIDLPPAGPVPEDWVSSKISKEFASTLIEAAALIDSIEHDELSQKRGAGGREPWSMGQNAALAYLGRTVPYGRARIVPPLKVDLIPLHGVMHIVLSRPDQSKITLGSTGRRPALLVPGDRDALPHRLAAGMEAQALTVMRRYTDRFCNRIGKTRVDISLTDDAGVWCTCDVKTERITYAWRLIMAPDYVCDYVAAREVARLPASGRARNLRSGTQKLRPDVDKAEAWLAANGPGLFRYGRM